LGTLAGLFDNTAGSGLHAIASGAGINRNVLVAVGIQAVPANNDPAFVGQFLQSGYLALGDENPVSVTIQLTNTSGYGAARQYEQPWGVLLHANAARTAANTATGLDQAAATALGGYMMYQVLAGNGTAAIKVQHAVSNVDGSFADLLTSGVITCGAGVSGVVALAKTATVNRYVRWQIALGTATSVTFALAFVRNYI
jgi:hypothetical protein